MAVVFVDIVAFAAADVVVVADVGAFVDFVGASILVADFDVVLVVDIVVAEVVAVVYL